MYTVEHWEMLESRTEKHEQHMMSWENVMIGMDEDDLYKLGLIREPDAHA